MSLSKNFPLKSMCRYQGIAGHHHKYDFEDRAKLAIIRFHFDIGAVMNAYLARFIFLLKFVSLSLHDWLPSFFILKCVSLSWLCMTGYYQGMMMKTGWSSQNQSMMMKTDVDIRATTVKNNEDFIFERSDETDCLESI